MPTCKEIIGLETYDNVRVFLIRKNLFLQAFVKPLLGLSMFRIDSHQVYASLITNRRFVTSKAANERVTFTISILFVNHSYPLRIKRTFS